MRQRQETRDGSILSRCLLTGLWIVGAVTCGTLANAEGPRKREEGVIALLLLPLGIVITATLQIAAMALFPRFARRCHSAIRHYRWQTPLLGFAGLLGVMMLAVIANQLAGGNELAGLLVLLSATVMAGVGGVGVSLQAGKWALNRINAAHQDHPVIAILVGASVLGWFMVVVPCLGQLLYLLVASAALGAFLFSLIAGRRLDEAPTDGFPPSEPTPSSAGTFEPPESARCDGTAPAQTSDDYQMF